MAHHLLSLVELPSFDVAAATARKKASRFSTSSEAAAFISSLSCTSVNDIPSG
jgi:hypothetical protein